MTKESGRLKDDELDAMEAAIEVREQLDRGEIEGHRPRSRL